MRGGRVPRGGGAAAAAEPASGQLVDAEPSFC